MGQTSLKYLNRVGYTQHWSKIWESKNNYSNFFLRSCFIDLFFDNFFRNNFFKRYNVIFNFKKNLCKTHSYKLCNGTTDFNKTFWYNVHNNFFTSNVWVLCYQNWIVFNTYIYNSNESKHLKNLKFFNRNKISTYNSLYYDFL